MREEVVTTLVDYAEGIRALMVSEDNSAWAESKLFRLQVSFHNYCTKFQPTAAEKEMAAEIWASKVGDF